MMRHLSISPRCFCCIGWHDAESALCWSGRREAPPLRCFLLLLLLRGCSGVAEAVPRGAARGESRAGTMRR